MKAKPQAAWWAPAEEAKPLVQLDCLLVWGTIGLWALAAVCFGGYWLWRAWTALKLMELIR